MNHLGSPPRDHRDRDEDDDEEKPILKRRACDFHTPSILALQNRLLSQTPLTVPLPHSTSRRLTTIPLQHLAPSPTTNLLPHVGSCYPTRQVAQVQTRDPTSVTAIAFSPGGRRCITGNGSGDFALWDGNTYAFELLMSAHNEPFRAMSFSKDGKSLITTSAAGEIKYWSETIAPLHSVYSHDNTSVNEITFSPNSAKFATAGDDCKVNVWDWETSRMERSLDGHGWDVKCADWHPASSLIASGGKDNLVKLFDPRNGGALATLYGHKNSMSKVKWNANGNWLLTASRDQLIKMYDIRTMKEMCSLTGHYKEVSSLAWHPIHESMFASGGMDGTILFWNVGASGHEEPQAKIQYAHDQAVWDMAWHPAGHCLVSGANDKYTKFWQRPITGGLMGEDYFNEIPGFGDRGEEDEIVFDSIPLGAHVGIVIGKKGATIISMQRSTQTKMHVDQTKRVLEIEGTRREIEHVRKRITHLLDRVEAQVQLQAAGGVFRSGPSKAEMTEHMMHSAGLKRKKMEATGERPKKPSGGGSFGVPGQYGHA